MTLPLVLLARRTRSLAFLAVVVVISYLGWALTGQYMRYLLPALAITTALAGIGIVSAFDTATSRARGLLSTAAQVGVIVGLLAAPLLFLPMFNSRWLPVDLIIGKETAEDFIAREVVAASALAAASAHLAPDTPVGYIGVWDAPQIYTEARLMRLGTVPLGRSLSSTAGLGTMADEVLANLNRLGIHYVIWHREDTTAEDWRSTFLSTDFLRAHTRILAGDRGAYLFEILPESGERWGVSERNLLEDPGLDQVRDGRPWTTTGKVNVRKPSLSMSSGSSIAQRVATTGGIPHLLVASGRCASPADRTILTLEWYDAHGGSLGSASETVVPGIEGSTQFLWHQAPDRAAAVSAELTPLAKCEFAEIALFGPP
jgi:hypothetical protein